MGLSAPSLSGCLRPQSAERHRVHAIAQFVDSRAAVDDRPGDEAFAQSVSEPEQVPGIADGRCRRGLDLEGDDTASAELDDEVDLPPAALLAKVVEHRERVGESKLRAQLGGGEGIEPSADEWS